MKDPLQEEAYDHYSNIVKKSDNLAETVGRPPSSLGIETDIWKDIKNKLNFESSDSILDIGCGYGELTQILVQELENLNCSLTLFDIPEVIKKISANFTYSHNCSFIEGLFPKDKNKIIKKYNKIIVYSVLHCTNNPYKFIIQSLKFLNPGGSILFGDIPNINKKGRFLSTTEGRKFDAEYKNIRLENVPFYKNHQDFVKKLPNMHNKNINDEFLLKLFSELRMQGFDVYILPQGNKLPFCKTREDLIIQSPGSQHS